ncbi:MAG: response regulator transcription factor [Clostridiales bacterium]|nr:response regulator transcription factor [Clostridiales bacterium]
MAVIWTVEDEERIGILIVDIIASMGHESRRFEDVDSLDKARRQHEAPDLLLLDLMLRGKSGFDVLTRWKQDLDTRRVPVIILSARSTEADKVRGLDLGAEDYITKPFSIRKLKSRINAALRRVVPAATRMDLGALALEPNNRGVTYLGRPVALTQQEFELLHYMAARAGQLLKDVWGYESETDASRTVDYHIRSLRRKLGDDAASPRLIETVHGSGYRLITPA